MFVVQNAIGVRQHLTTPRVLRIVREAMGVRSDLNLRETLEQCPPNNIKRLLLLVEEPNLPLLFEGERVLGWSALRPWERARLVHEILNTGNVPLYAPQRAAFMRAWRGVA